MAISNDTKQAIKIEIERLEQSKAPIKFQLAEVTLKKDRYKARIDEIDAAIAKLKIDLNA